MTCTIIADKIKWDFILKSLNQKAFTSLKYKLYEIIWNEYCKGVTDFYVNCEYGITLWSAEIICKLKLDYKIKLHIVVPYENQALSWTEKQRDIYYFVNEHSDSVELARFHYQSDCYDTADKIMADKSHRLLFFSNFKNKDFVLGYIDKT